MHSVLQHYAATDRHRELRREADAWRRAQAVRRRQRSSRRHSSRGFAEWTSTAPVPPAATPTVTPTATTDAGPGGQLVGAGASEARS